MAELVLERGPRFDSAGSRHDQFGEFCHSLRRRRALRRGHDGREQGEHACVDPVGLGEDALRLGEHAYAVGIDDGDRHGGGDKTTVQMAMPFAGGLDDDERNVVTAEANV